MNEPTALAEAKETATLDRRGKARHTDHRLLRREVHHLKAIQPLKRFAGYPSLHPRTRSKVSEIDVDAARVLLDHPAEPSSEKCRRRAEVLRPHLLDVSVAQPPSIIGLSRNRTHAQRNGIWCIVHTQVKAKHQVDRDILCGLSGQLMGQLATLARVDSVDADAYCVEGVHEVLP